MRISEPSFTDSGIDATGKTENQTCTRVDGRSAPSTLSLPKSASAEGLGHGFPYRARLAGRFGGVRSLFFANYVRKIM